MAYLKNAESLNDFVSALDQDNIKYGCIQSLDQLTQADAEQVKNAMLKKLEGYLPQSVMSTQEIA